MSEPTWSDAAQPSIWIKRNGLGVRHAHPVDHGRSRGARRTGKPPTLVCLAVGAFILACSCNRSAGWPSETGAEEAAREGSQRGATGATAGASTQKPQPRATPLRLDLPLPSSYRWSLRAARYESRLMVTEAVCYATGISGAGQFWRIMSTGTVIVTPSGTQYRTATQINAVIKNSVQTEGQT
jgi:hypothetical protein